MKLPPYNIIITDQSEKTCLSLSNELRKLSWVGDINTAPNLEKATHRLSTVIRCDAIGSSFGVETICEFIKAAKKTDNGVECAYIIILESGEPDKEIIAEFAKAGVAGFLLEPVNKDSVDPMYYIIQRKLKQIAKVKEDLANYHGPSQLLQKKFEESKEKE